MPATYSKKCQFNSIFLCHSLHLTETIFSTRSQSGRNRIGISPFELCKLAAFTSSRPLLTLNPTSPFECENGRAPAESDGKLIISAVSFSLQLSTSRRRRRTAENTNHGILGMSWASLTTSNNHFITYFELIVVITSNYISGIFFSFFGWLLGINFENNKRIQNIVFCINKILFFWQHPPQNI